MYKQQQLQNSSLLGGRQCNAGKIVKRKNLTSMSIHNHSQISGSQLVDGNQQEDDNQYTISPDELKQYPMGEMLLREEELM